MGELGRAVLIGRMGDVVELVLDQGAKLGVGAFRAEISGKRDQIIRHFAEPVPHLLLLASLLPAASAEHDLLGLAQNPPTLLGESGRCPEHTDVGVDQMAVVFVMDAAGGGENLGLKPFPHLKSWGQANTEVG